MIDVAIVGASGYTGADLIRLLLLHPQAKIAWVLGGRAAGGPIGRVFPQFPGVLESIVTPFDPDEIASTAGVAFGALPHGESAPAVAALVERGLTVLDLSADFRLHD